MTKSSGTGVITSRGLTILEYCRLNSVAMEYKEFSVSSSTGDTYAQMINPSYSGHLNMLEEEVTTVIGNVEYSGDSQDSGNFLSNADSTINNVVCNIPANGILTDVDLRTIWLSGKDQELDVKIEVDTYATFVVGDVLIGATSGATGEIVKLYTDGGGDKFIYVKDVVGIFQLAESMDTSPTSGGVAVIQDFYTEYKLSIASTSLFTIGDAISGATSLATGTIYDKTGGALFVKDVTGDFQALENIIITSTATVGGSTTAIVETNFNFVVYKGFMVYDSVGPTIENLEFVSNGRDENITLQLKQNTGLPTSLDFIDSRYVEISQHDVDNYAHRYSLLMLDGANSPVANVDWGAYKITNLGSASAAGDAARLDDIITVANQTTTLNNYTEWVAWLATLPPVIENTLTITLANHSSFVGQSLTIDGKSGAGTILIMGSALTCASVVISDCKCKVFVSNLTTDTASTGIAISYSDYVYLNSITFSNLTRCLDVSYANVDCNSCVIGSSNVNGFRALDGGSITLSAITQSSISNISGTLYEAEYSGKIFKPLVNIGDASIPRSTTFEEITDGGSIIGAYGVDGEVPVGTDYDIEIDTTAQAEALTYGLKTFGSNLPKNLSLNILFLDTLDLGLTREFDMTGEDPITIEGFRGAGEINIATQNTNYNNMVLINDGLIFDIKNNKSKITFGDLTLQGDGVTSSDYGISVSNCDHFVVAPGAGDKLIITSDTANAIKIDSCSLIDMSDVNITMTNTTNAAIDINKTALGNIIDSNFASGGHYIVVNYSKVSIIDGADVGATSGAAKRFCAYTGSDLNISGAFEIGTGSAEDIKDHVLADKDSVIRSSDSVTGNSTITINQNTVTLS